MVQSIQKEIDSGNDIKIGDKLLEQAMNFICSLIFGQRYSDLQGESNELKHFPKIIWDANALSVKFNLGDLFPWLAWADIGGHEKELKEFNKLAGRVFGSVIEVM
jgi:hypothetical protein